MNPKLSLDHVTTARELRQKTEEDRKAKQALVFYSQRKEMKKIEYGVEEDTNLGENERLQMYKKRKELEMDSGQKRNIKMVNLEDFTIQEIEADMDLQFLRYKKKKAHEVN